MSTLDSALLVAPVAAPAPQDYIAKLSEIDALIQELRAFPALAVAPPPNPTVASLETGGKKGVKRLRDFADPVEAESAEKKEKREKEERVEASLEEQLRVKLVLFRDLSPLKSLAEKVQELVSQTLLAVMECQIPLDHKKVLIELFKRGCNSKTQRSYWSYGISQKDAKFLVELIDAGLSLTLRFSGVTLLEQLLRDDLELADQVLLARPLSENRVVLKHAETLFFRFLHQGIGPQVQFLSRKMGPLLKKSLEERGFLKSLIEEGDLARLRVCIKECGISLAARGGYQEKTYAPCEIATDGFTVDGFFPLALAVQSRSKALYPWLKVDDENIAKNLYAYLEQTLMKPDLAEFRRLPERTKEFLALADNPAAVLNFSWLIHVRDWNFTGKGLP